MDVTIRTWSGDTTRLDEAAVGAFRAALRGTLCLPDEPGYDAARRIWNAMVDRRPAMIVQALGAADVMQTVNFAREQGSV
ncbi:MAG TPA: FAD-linked oxidase, partial [Rhodopila sp.]|nr:FAD-linked oxidase [Rhodopila sp.]